MGELQSQWDRGLSQKSDSLLFVILLMVYITGGRDIQKLHASEVLYPDSTSR